MSKISNSSPATINEVEAVIQTGLEALSGAPLNEQIVAALEFLVPAGYKPVVQLEEDGRKKRGNASAGNWKPETGEIVIFFERKAAGDVVSEAEKVDVAPVPGRPLSATFEKMNQAVAAGDRLDPLLATAEERSRSTRNAVLKASGTTVEPTVTDKEIEELCVALAEAEKAGLAFIAITRFRDGELTQHRYSWTESLAQRQAVLARAIAVGAVLKNQIPNPRSPHLTTTIKLNRESKYALAVPPRFLPIQLRGDGPSASETLLRDRGRI